MLSMGMTMIEAAASSILLVIGIVVSRAGDNGTAALYLAAAILIATIGF